MTVRLEPWPSESFPEWLAERQETYTDERVRAGEERSVAEKIAAESMGRYFPNGRTAEGHAVFAVVVDDVSRGMLWVGPHPDGTVGAAWIWDIEIYEEFRGAGHGRAAMSAAEDWARSAGYTTLALNVFGFNTAARNLYESLGFEPTSIRMQKSL